MLEAQFDTVRRRFGGPTVMVRTSISSGSRTSSRAISPARFEPSVCRWCTPGTPFQLRVWEKLLVVPYGETRSYQDLALAIGDPAAVQGGGPGETA